MTDTPLSVVDLAVFIIPDKDNSGQKPMTLRKLLKLAYYCQAWSLVWDGVPLFKEDIVACPHRGPIVPALEEYAVSRFAKVRTIKEGVYQAFDTDMDLCFDGLSNRPEKLKKYQEKTVLSVLNEYGRSDVDSLEDLSKQEGPFKKAIAQGGNQKPLITLESLERYYSALEKVRHRMRHSSSLNRDYKCSYFILDFPAWDGP